jgi:hypothetical protein
VPGANRYELRVDQLEPSQVQVIYETELTGTSFVPPTPLAPQRFRAWIRAAASSGELTDWSEPVTFTLPLTSLDNDDSSLESDDLLLVQAFRHVPDLLTQKSPRETTRLEVDGECRKNGTAHSSSIESSDPQRDDSKYEPSPFIRRLHQSESLESTIVSETEEFTIGNIDLLFCDLPMTELDAPAI